MNLSKVTNTTNPFDSGMLENLSTTMPFSPDMFSTKSKETPSQSSFRWSIEQMARLHPVDIDESEINVVESPDSLLEARANSAIEKFWSSQKFVVPSPDTNLGKSISGSSDYLYLQPRTSQSERRLIEKRSANRNRKYEESPLVRGGPRSAIVSRRHKETQTLFTFPPTLDLVKLLGGSFQYDEIDGDAEEAAFEANLSINTLRRKLFTEDSEISFTTKDDNTKCRRSTRQKTSSKSPERNGPAGSTSDISLKSFDDSVSIEESVDSESSQDFEGECLPCKGQRRMPSPGVSPIKVEF